MKKFEVDLVKTIRSLSNEQLAAYITQQLNHFFPDNRPIAESEVLKAIQISEERIFYCFQNIRKKYFHIDGNTQFNHLISDQYCMYLYMLSNFYYRETKEEHLSTKLYYLNKALHAVDIFYTSHLPDIFLLVHPLGTIIGRATFSDYFIAYQGCTVGCLNEGVFPTFTGKTIMYANSSVLGNSVIGDNVCFAANSTVINKNIDANKIVIGSSPSLFTRPNTKTIEERPPFVYG
jgi:serine O-acetyltransferase